MCFPSSDKGVPVTSLLLYRHSPLDGPALSPRLNCMAKQCHQFEHTADIGLNAQADTLSELLEALAEGLADAICDRQLVNPKQSHIVEIQASENTEDLAVDFLSVAMNTIQGKHFMVHSVHVELKDSRLLISRLLGEPYDEARHDLKTEIKAVTYHQLKVEREGPIWVGRVILDI